jgi:hypothetical protein
VQWFRAEAEMYRWLENYERKHAELMRVIERFRRDGEVWGLRATRLENDPNHNRGVATFAFAQVGMFRRLETNAREIFKSRASGAHQDWVSAGTFDEFVVKVVQWRDEVFKWMDELVRLSRPAYKFY